MMTVRGIKESHMRMFKQSNERHPRDKATDVCEERHASALTSKAHASAEELHDKP